MKKFIIFLILFLFSFSVYAKINIQIDFGLGNLTAIYLSHNIISGHLLGIGSGYILYNNDVDNASLNIFSPTLIYTSSFIYNLIFFRCRYSLDYVSENGSRYLRKTTSFSPDILFKVIKFKSSFVYGGTCLPIVFGSKETKTGILIGAGYNFNF